MSDLLNTALDFMGFLTTDEDDDNDITRIETMNEQNYETNVAWHPKVPRPTIVHITPKVFDDVLGIAKRLQNKTIVTINLELVNVALRNRMIDFACGSVYALDGGIMKLADNVYLLASQGVTLKERP